MKSERRRAKNEKRELKGILCLTLFSFGAILAVISLAFSLFLAGCGEDEEKIRVGVSISGIPHPDSLLIKEAMKESAGKYGARIVLETKGFAELLDKGVDVLIFNCPDPRETEFAVKEIHHRSVPVIVLNCPPPQNLHVEAYIKVNQFDAGKMAADYVVKKLGGNGNVIVLEGSPGDEVSRQIALGMYSVLERYESIRIVANERHPDWNKKLAEDTVRFTLNKYADNIQAVLAGSSQLAIGAVQAVMERRLADRIITAGIGADLESCKAIVAGAHDVEIDRMPYERGLEALALAVAVAKDEDFAYDEEIREKAPKIKVKFSPLRLITEENMLVMNRALPQLADEH